MSLQERVRRKQGYLDSRQRQLNSKQNESRFQHKARKVETDCPDCRDNTTTSRSTLSVEQAKAGKIETETSRQRAERLKVLGKTNEEKLRRNSSPLKLPLKSCHLACWTWLGKSEINRSTSISNSMKPIKPYPTCFEWLRMNAFSRVISKTGLTSVVPRVDMFQLPSKK